MQKNTFAQRLRDWLRLDGSDSDTTSQTELIDLREKDIRSLRLPDALQDRYKVLRMLGRGAFGVVLLARDMMIGRLISIKLLSHSRVSEDIYRLFLQEARIAGQIEHPNIVTIYDVHDDRRYACLIMEYLAGGNLETMLRLDGPLSQASAVSYMYEIIDGLRAAHHMGVIHRDIKPPNILFDQNGTPVISDFGVAQLPMEGFLALEGNDEALRVVGTPEYMAPEQMAFGATIDGRADLYSAGLLFYEMVTGQRLYNFGPVKNIEELAAKAQKLDPEQLVNFPASVTNGVREIILKLIQIKPRDRYPDARSVLMALDAVNLQDSLHEVKAEPNESVTRREMFQDILRLFLVDGVISPPERRELAKRAQRLGVPPAIARELEEGIRQELGLPLLEHLIEYEAQAEQLLADRTYSDADELVLTKLADKHGISRHEQRKIRDRVMIKFRMKEE